MMVRPDSINRHRAAEIAGKGVSHDPDFNFVKIGIIIKDNEV